MGSATLLPMALTRTAAGQVARGQGSASGLPPSVLVLGSDTILSLMFLTSLRVHFHASSHSFLK